MRSKKLLSLGAICYLVIGNYCYLHYTDERTKAWEDWGEKFFFFFFQNYEKAFLVTQPIYLVKCVRGMWASALHSKYEV